MTLFTDKITNELIKGTSYEKLFIKEYKEAYSRVQEASFKDYFDNKLTHAYEMINICKAIKLNSSESDVVSHFLHDIGRFREYSCGLNVDHATLGCEILTQNGITNVDILLPIKYHEVDTGWLEILMKDPLYLELREDHRKSVVFSCKLLKDSDIISNMILLLESSSERDSIMSPDLLSLLLSRELGKESLVHSLADKLIYILCGLSIINLDESFNFLKTSQIVSRLVCKINNVSRSNHASIYFRKNINVFLRKEYPKLY